MLGVQAQLTIASCNKTFVHQQHHSLCSSHRSLTASSVHSLDVLLTLAPSDEVVHHYHHFAASFLVAVNFNVAWSSTLNGARFSGDHYSKTAATALQPSTSHEQADVVFGAHSGVARQRITAAKHRTLHHTMVAAAASPEIVGESDSLEIVHMAPHTRGDTLPIALAGHS